MRIRKLVPALLLGAAVLAPTGASAGYDPVARIKAAHERHVAQARKVSREVRQTVESRHETHKNRASRVRAAVEDRHRTHTRRASRAVDVVQERHAAHRRAVRPVTDAVARRFDAVTDGTPFRQARLRHPRFARTPGEAHASLADWVRARHEARLRFLEQHRLG